MGRRPWFSERISRPGVEQPSYEEQLLLSEHDIHVMTSEYIDKYKKLERDFRQKTSLTHLDISILLIAATFQVLRWALLRNDTMRFNKASDSDKFFENIAGSLGEYLPASVETIVTDHTVPYDAIRLSDRFKGIYSEGTGISGVNHRYKTLGHDPLAGWVVGTANIATNTLSVNDVSSLFPSYHIRNQEFYAKTSLLQIMDWSIDMVQEKPEVIGAAFLKQAVHYSTDVFTKQGLPLPIINQVSPEASKFLVGNNIDVYSVTRGMAFSLLINKLIAMFHRLFFDSHSDDPKLYDVRTRKIVMYSNTLSTAINLGYVSLTKDFKALDVGGMLVTLWRILTDRKKIHEIKMEFIQKTLDDCFKKEEDAVNQRLAQYGFQI